MNDNKMHKTDLNTSNYPKVKKSPLVLVQSPTTCYSIFLLQALHVSAFPAFHWEQEGHLFMGNSPDANLSFCAFNAPASCTSSRGKMVHLHSLWNGGKSSFVAVAISIFLFAIASQIGQQSGAGATSKYLSPSMEKGKHYES